MKKIMTSTAVVAMLTVGTVSQALALGNVNTNFNFDNKRDHSQRYGNNASVNSNNRTSSVTNRNDNRSWQTSTTTTSTDNRDYSDRSVRMDNRVDNTRNQSHNYGDGAIVINGEGYKPRIGHEQAGVSGLSGSNNYVDQSVSGNFGIGHTR